MAQASQCSQFLPSKDEEQSSAMCALDFTFKIQEKNLFTIVVICGIFGSQMRSIIQQKCQNKSRSYHAQIYLVTYLKDTY